MSPSIPHTAESGAARKSPKGSRAKRARATQRDALPLFVPPCLATLSEDAPEGRDWVHEVKFDGYRLQARIDNGHVQLLTRSGQDWTHRFGSIARALASLKVETALSLLAFGAQPAFLARYRRERIGELTISDLERIQARAAAAVAFEFRRAELLAELDKKKVDREDLRVKRAYAGEGRSLKRWRAKARGRVAPILHRTSHITVVVEDR